ncbi:MAG: polyamine aminopropyltransferase [Gammaproteobacteria bacterium]|nr:polyamine aminopropyltransferase [Gammaproteobacteria bacterium]MCW8923223.1 polyamine aminopropyltransferase [Gammaproteobacteria bacterium]
MSDFFTETLYDPLGQSFRIDKLYYEQKTEHQHLMIFHNAFLGRVMTLDGVVQTTERDEFIYHEMMAHVPMFAHGNAKKVLIIGGGDGGMLREALRHKNVEQVTMVEIDGAVIEMSKQWLPNHSQGAFDDPRANIVIADGMDFVRETEMRFDVIISDSTDPIGPGEVLFSNDFYAQCKRILNPGGVMVTQNGVPFFQVDEVRNTAIRMSASFSDQTFYSAAVPTYYGGIMTFAWGSDESTLRTIDLDSLQQRYQQAGIETRYYTPEIHRASFALPRYVDIAIAEAKA